MSKTQKVLFSLTLVAIAILVVFLIASFGYISKQNRIIDDQTLKIEERDNEIEGLNIRIDNYEVDLSALTEENQKTQSELKTCQENLAKKN